MDGTLVNTLLVGVTIFLLQALNITLNSLRVTMLVRGHRLAAGGLALLESSVWVYAAGQVLTDLGNPVKVVAYASGFAVGTMIGVTVEKWLALGKGILRIVSPVDSPRLIDTLREHGYYATVVNASGRDGDVRIIFTVVPRKKIPQVEKLVREVNPQAFITVEETKTLATMKRHRAVPTGALATMGDVFTGRAKHD